MCEAKIGKKRKNAPRTLFMWWDALIRKNFEKKTHFYGKTHFFAKKRREIVAFFHEKQKYFRENKKLIFVVPNAKSVFAWKTRKERPRRSLRMTLFGTLFIEDKVCHLAHR